LQLLLRCGAICLIALFAALFNQERSASKQLAPQLPYTRLQTAIRRQTLAPRQRRLLQDWPVASFCLSSKCFSIAEMK
jgi:hypothetical protein